MLYEEQAADTAVIEPVLIEQEAGRSDITYRAALLELITYAAPYTASSLITIGGSFAGVVMLSRIGSKELAASNLTSSMQSWLTNTVGATLAATAVMAARKIGTGEISRVGSVLHQSWVFTLALSVPCVTLVLFSKPILTALKQDSELLDLVKDFCIGYSFGIPATFLLFCNRVLALATGNALINLPFDIFYQALNLGLGYCLIFGALKFPKLGFSGLGYSNSITSRPR